MLQGQKIVQRSLSPFEDTITTLSFQGIVLIQGSNLDLLHCRQTLYHLSHQGSPYVACLILINRYHRAPNYPVTHNPPLWRTPYLMQCSAVVIFKHSTTVETWTLQIMQLVLVTWFWTCDDLLMFCFPWSQPHVWGLSNAAFLAPGIERHRNKSQKQQRSLNLWPQQQDLTWVWQAH